MDYQPRKDPNDELKSLDNLLYDILRDDSPTKGTGNKIPHLNQKNNADNLAKMRDTRD